MKMVLPETSRLQIQRFRAHYLVSSAHPWPERVKAHLDDTVTHHLSQTLSTLLSPWFSDADPSLWLIRRLQIALDVNAGWERESLARAWAAQIRRWLDTTLRAGSDGENVVWFPDRAAYLGRFVVDVTQGRAWSKWYYEAFEGLRPLPISATLRTAICDQPTVGRAALLQLPASELQQVLRALTASDARRILDGIAADASQEDEVRCLQAAWSVWESVEGTSDTGIEEWHRALRIYLQASRGMADVGGPPLRGAVLALLCLARCLLHGAMARGQEVLVALVQEDLSALYLAAGTADAEVLLPWRRCSPAWVREVGETLLARRTGQATDQRATVEGPSYTAFGGLFLVLPLLDELPLVNATHGWPDTEDAAAVALVRFLLLVKCCGRNRAHRAFSDPLLRDLLGMPPALALDTLAGWQAGISAAHQQQFLETLEAWYRERGAVGGAAQVLVRIPAHGAPVGILLDSARGVWVYAGGYSPRKPARLLDQLLLFLPSPLRGIGANLSCKSWHQAPISPPATRGKFFPNPSPLEGEGGDGREGADGEEQASPVLLSDPVFLDALHAAYSEARILSLLDEAIVPMAEADPRLAEILARLHKLPGDFAYLSLPSTFGLASSLDRTLSVAAQGLMRAFAWRLPGFAGSNLPYLYTNFLDCAGSLEEEPTRRVVRLGRPPLHLVLYLTGMARAAYCVSWLDDRPLALFPEA
jgi:drug/metabolite transporter superfamily protein YnfA